MNPVGNQFSRAPVIIVPVNRLCTVRLPKPILELSLISIMLHSYIRLCPIMQATRPLVNQTRHNGTHFYSCSLCLLWTMSGRVLLWYDIRQPVRPNLLKVPNIYPTLGLYSGIFAIYLAHRGSRQSTDKAKNILFYALCVLYALTAATNIIDILVSSWPDLVSVDDHGCLILFQLVVLQTMIIAYHLQIIGVTLFACCDFIAQSILVCTTQQCSSFTLFI